VTIPNGWAAIRIEDLAADEAGALTDGPFGSNLKTSHYTVRGPRVIRLQNIGEGVFCGDRAHIEPTHFEKLRKHEARAGDVVVAMLGEPLPRACVVPSHVGPAIVKADCVRLRVEPRLALAKYVAAGLNSDPLKRQAASLVHGVGRPRLGLGRFRELEFPLAPLAEQERIVEAIDSYSSRLDEAEAALERVQRNLTRYRAAVLRAAVEGRLVPTEATLARAERRDYEPASELLKRILAERRRRWEAGEMARLTKAVGKVPGDDRWKKAYREPAALSLGGLPPLPEGWSWALLDQLLDQPLENGRSVPDATEGFPVLRLTAVRSDSIDLRERKVGRWSGDEAQKFLLQRGDFLVSRGNGSRSLVGKGALVVQDPDPVAFPDTLIRIRIASEHFSPRLLAILWNSALIRGHIERRAKTTAGIYKINQADLAATPLPLAPRLEQERLLRELERHLSVQKEAGVSVSIQTRRCARLRQAILKWAFEGKLVDQDPSDEPASLLLERIRADRVATQGQASVGRSRGRKTTRR